MSKIKKIYLSVALLLVGIVVIAVSIVLSWHDGDKIDDRDLLLSTVIVPEEKNAFPYFSEASEKIYWPSEESVVIDFLSGEEVNDKELETLNMLIKRNREIFELIHQGTECQQYAVPGIDIMKKETVFLKYFVQIARVMAVRIRLQADAEEQEAAFNSLITFLKYAILVQQDAPLLVHYVTGSAILFVALDQVRYLLYKNKLSNKQLAVLSQLLSECPCTSAALIQALKGHYNMNIRFIDQVIKGGSNGRQVGYPGKTLKDIPYFFQPNNTKRITAKYYRN